MCQRMAQRCDISGTHLYLSNRYQKIILYFETHTSILKWVKECLNVVRAREPTHISQMGIKTLLSIFKCIISLLPNSLRSRLVKLWTKITRKQAEVEKKGPKKFTSSPRIRTTCTTLKWVSKYDFIFSNEEIFFSKITFIRG